MATVQRKSAAVIFGRVWDDSKGHAGWTVPAARHVLKLGFSDEEFARMHELAALNRDGRISAEELAELDDYILAADMLSIIQAKARLFLKRRSPGSRNGHG